MIWRIALAAWLTLLLAVVGQQSHAQFNGCSAGFCSRVAGSVVATTTFDPLKKGTSITLSPDKLTATNSVGSNSSVLSIASASSGLKCFQAVYSLAVTPNRVLIGIGNASTLLNSFLGNSSDSFGWAGDGTLFPAGMVQSFAQGDTLSIEADTAHKTIFFRTNSGNWNNSGTANPETNTGGVDYSAVTGAIFAAAGTFQDATVVTANFGGSIYSPSLTASCTNF